MRKLMIAAALAGAMGLAAQSAAAQARPVTFGPELSWMSNSVGAGLGARVIYPGLGSALQVNGLEAYASFDYFFPSHATFWEINAGASYTVPVEGLRGFAPYVGGGLNVAHPGTTSLGLNILGGGRFTISPKLHGFAEARLELRSGTPFVLCAGILF
jgi:hypothetical protein